MYNLIFFFRWQPYLQIFLRLKSIFCLILYLLFFTYLKLTIFLPLEQSLGISETCLKLIYIANSNNHRQSLKCRDLIIMLWWLILILIFFTTLISKLKLCWQSYANYFQYTLFIPVFCNVRNVLLNLFLIKLKMFGKLATLTKDIVYCKPS